MCCLELQVSNWITARGLSRARSLWTNTLNRFATAAGKKESNWGLQIGAHAGPAIVENFGGGRFFDYTAYGDTINVAARLENRH
jgi:class 3 adenylate cyclase